jgi:hypothetical protein
MPRSRAALAFARRHWPDEELGEDELERLRAVYEEFARQVREQLKPGVLATDTPEAQATSLQHPAREMKGGRRAASLVLFDQAGTPLWSTVLVSQQGEARS